MKFLHLFILSVNCFSIDKGSLPNAIFYKLSNGNYEINLKNSDSIPVFQDGKSVGSINVDDNLTTALKSLDGNGDSAFSKSEYDNALNNFKYSLNNLAGTSSIKTLLNVIEDADVSNQEGSCMEQVLRIENCDISYSPSFSNMDTMVWQSLIDAYKGSCITMNSVSFNSSFANIDQQIKDATENVTLCSHSAPSCYDRWICLQTMMSVQTVIVSKLLEYQAALNEDKNTAREYLRMKTSSRQALVTYGAMADKLNLKGSIKESFEFIDLFSTTVLEVATGNFVTPFVLLTSLLLYGAVEATESSKKYGYTPFDKNTVDQTCGYVQYQTLCYPMKMEIECHQGGLLINDLSCQAADDTLGWQKCSRGLFQTGCQPFCLLPLVIGCDFSKYRFQVHKMISGEILSELRTKSMSICQNACDTESECNAFQLGDRIGSVGKAIRAFGLRCTLFTGKVSFAFGAGQIAAIKN